MTAPVRVFVARDGNAFMRDIAEWIAEAASSAGRDASIVDDRLPALDGAINLVVAPHELFELSDAPKADLQRAAAVSVCVCTEQPWTPWFHLSTDACRRGLLSLDISPDGVAALRSIGLAAERLVLGAVPSMSGPSAGTEDADIALRPVEVMFMGGLDERRERVLAALAPQLVRHRCDLRLFRFERPVTPTTPGVVFGRDKYAALSSTQVLLNIHRDRSMHLAAGAPPSRYFEWARMVEAMANGCVVLTEPCEGYEPLLPGVHFVEADAHEMGAALEALLGDTDRLRAIGDAGRAAVTGPLALTTGLAPVLDAIERDVLPRLPFHLAASDPTAGEWRLGSLGVPPPVRLGTFRPYRHLQRRAKALALAENRALRRLDAARCVLRHGAPQHIVRVETPSHAQVQPEVTVVVSLYDYGSVVRETLDSVAASTGIAYEVVVVEDHSTDDSRAVAMTYLDEHPDVPMLLLAKDANAGLAAARNTGFEHARAPFVMVIDADNHVHPRCLRTLADALLADPAAGAAYGILEEFGAHRGLRSALAWDVERLCRANYIDAQAMLRRDVWRELGGYRDEDDHVFGWEDWDLWLRLADSGRHAVHVREILGRYRVQSGSMIALTNLATDEAIVAIETRYPRLPWPDSRPA